MNGKRIMRLFVCVAVLTYFLLPAQAAKQDPDPTLPILSLLLSDNITMQEKIPSLALMIAKNTDTIEMAWIPGIDSITPVNQIQYNVYLSTSENFTPGPASFKKTIAGTSLAQYDFEASGSVDKSFLLWNRTWTSV